MALSIDPVATAIDPGPVTDLPDEQKNDALKLTTELEQLAAEMHVIVQRSMETEIEAVGYWFPIQKPKEVNERLNAEFEVARARMKEILALF